MVDYSVPAVYHNSLASQDNPLIEALPPQMTMEELQTTLEKIPVLPIGWERLPPLERQALNERIKEMYLPLEYTASIYALLYHGLRTAYTGRTQIVMTQHMTEIGNAARAKQFAIIPDSIIQADSFAVLGEPGMGKSTTIRRILKLIPPVIRHTRYKKNEFEQLQIPCLMIECPANHSARSMCIQILDKVDMLLGTSFADEGIRRRVNVDMLITRIAQLCTRFCVGAIVIDEIQNILTVSQKDPHSGSAFIKTLVELSNKTGVCLVCIGTPVVAPFFNAQAHLARRTRGPRIPNLNNGETFRSILSQMWDGLAVLEKGDLTKEMADSVYGYTAGNIAKMAALLTYAANEAIFFHRERIDAEQLRSVSRKYDIEAKKPSFAPENVKQLKVERGKEIQTLKDEQKVPFMERRGRPKKHHSEMDIIAAYEDCKQHGMNLSNRLAYMGLSIELQKGKGNE